MKRDVRLFLQDILTAIEAIERFVNGLDYQGFIDDDKTSSAVVLKLQRIGEASKRIPRSVRDQSSIVPWKEMSGMRDRLVHAYFGIDYSLVWEVIMTAIPRIKPEITRLIQEVSI